VLLLIALCVSVLSGALAAGEETPLVVPIGQETAVFGADGAQIGTLRPDSTKGTVLTLVSGEEFDGIQVAFDQAAANNTETNEALVGKTRVVCISVNATVQPANTPDATVATMPTEVWIDSNLVVTALAARHATDASAIKSKDQEIASLQDQVNAVKESDLNPTSPMVEKEPGIFSAGKLAVWVPVAAIALGIFGLGLLAWIAISTATTAWDTETQTKHLAKLNERLSEGLLLKTPVRIEQIAWPREGHVKLAPDVVEQLATFTAQNGALYERTNTYVKEVELPPPIPEGEEPDILQLTNRLAGVPSASEWRDLVHDAGWHAVLLQANPTEKGTYIADDGGYSIIACLMRTPDAEIGYVMPSYQDPNASEKIWHEIYSVTESTSVRNFQVDVMAVVHIERGTFFLPKSKGKLTRRPQQF